MNLPVRLLLVKPSKCQVNITGLSPREKRRNRRGARVTLSYLVFKIFQLCGDVVHEFVFRAGHILLPYVSCLTVPDSRIAGVSLILLTSTLYLYMEATDFSKCFSVRNADLLSL